MLLNNKASQHIYGPKRIENKQTMTKEQFMIEWVLLRASFRETFSGVYAAEEASDVWERIQRLK
jgi:hypothetical protein